MNPRCPCCGWTLSLEGGGSSHLWRAHCRNCHCHAREIPASISVREVCEALARRGPCDVQQLLETLGWRAGANSARYYLKICARSGIAVQRADGKWKLTQPTLQPGRPC